MARQYVGDLVADPQATTPTALTATTIEALWPAATYSPMALADMKVGKIFEIVAAGIWTTNTTGTLIITPTLTGGSIALGVSQTQTPPFSMTAVPWKITAELIIRTANNISGTNSTAILTGMFVSGGLTTNASPGGSINLGFGGTVGTFDSSIAQSIQIQKTLSVAGSMTTLYAYMKTVN